MNLDARIQWLHKKICENCYPNAMRLAEKFNISHRQAQRDIDHLRTAYGAPLKYSASHKGFYYESEFSLPLVTLTENDSEFSDVVSGFGYSGFAERSVIQMQIPYSAQLEIKDKLTVMNLRPFIVAQLPKHVYECEFQSVEMFIGIIMAFETDIKIVSPDWLRKKMLDAAERVIRNNKNI
ncbi:MAG: hypothetical protein E7641_03595 [Ruminococcaceae bacterium]|nr:hypothetical protein [Oscillospiraceae bacterium]